MTPRSGRQGPWRFKNCTVYPRSEKKSTLAFPSGLLINEGEGPCRLKGSPRQERFPFGGERGAVLPGPSQPQVHLPYWGRRHCQLLQVTGSGGRREGRVGTAETAESYLGVILLLFLLSNHPKFKSKKGTQK